MVPNNGMGYGCRLCGLLDKDAQVRVPLLSAASAAARWLGFGSACHSNGGRWMAYKWKLFLSLRSMYRLDPLGTDRSRSSQSWDGGGGGPI